MIGIFFEDATSMNDGQISVSNKISAIGSKLLKKPFTHSIKSHGA